MIDLNYIRTLDDKSKASYIMDMVERFISTNNFAQLNQLLLSINMPEVGPVCAISLVKSTARVRTHLPVYDFTLGLANNYLCALGYDGDKILRNLYV